MEVRVLKYKQCDGLIEATMLEEVLNLCLNYAF